MSLFLSPLTGVDFAHPLEEHFSNVATRNHLQWIYKPVNFTLNGSDFSPDFYLPQKELFVEVVTFRKKLATKLNIKTLKKLYPHIQIIAAEPRRFEKLVSNLI